MCNLDSDTIKRLAELFINEIRQYRELADKEKGVENGSDLFVFSVPPQIGNDCKGVVMKRCEVLKREIQAQMIALDAVGGIQLGRAICQVLGEHDDYETEKYYSYRKEVECDSDVHYRRHNFMSFFNENATGMFKGWMS